MMNIQKANLNDLEQLTVLFDGYRVFYNKESNLKEGREFIKQRLINNESEIFVAYNKSGNMTGFVQLYPIFSSTRMKKMWLLNDLFVRADFRGQGISVALINKAKELCESSGSCGMILETAKSNLVGNQLYPKTSFTLDEVHNYYYWDTEN